MNNIILSTSTIIEALRKLNELSGKEMTLFVVDEANVMLGTVTDGDIRRALLHGCELASSITEAMHQNFKALAAGDIDVAKIKDYRNRGIKLIPVIDDSGRLTSTINLDTCITKLPLSAILMAGGKGERLRPLTLDTPKPLLPIGGRAIIDYNISALHQCGIEDITVTTNYLAEKIVGHFAGTTVKCIKEPTFLGTIGSAALADIPSNGCTIVMNSDLLTTISYEDMYLHHVSVGADITIAAIPYQVSVPFAILSVNPEDQSLIDGLTEKPSYSYFANAGIYIFPNELLKSLPLNQRTDAPDLIEQAIHDGMKVSYFPINGTWIDIGSPSDFKQANELMKTIKGFNK